MRIGEMFLGRVEAQGEQSVQTKFFIFGVPVFPMESFWATSDAANGVVGFPIPLHPMSVAMGYLRMYAWLGAFLASVFGYIEHRDYHPAYGMFALAALCLGLAILGQFFLGRVSGREGVRREVLHRFTGLYAPPEILPSDKRVELGMLLLRRWKDAHPGVDWKQRVDSGKASASEWDLLYAVARYQLDPRAESIAVAMGL
jgi:hypothetical protein